ncbi:MAG: immune inhibitor A [Verrucomicrobia bacterium]|nr:immune inhibitor A [Verrucomicrobiota bacterium]
MGVPTGAPAERHDGSKVAGTIIDGNYCDAHYGRDSRLISPFTQVPAAPNPRLRFRYWFNFYWDDYVQVQVREVGGEWQPLPNGTYPPGLSSCGRWERASLDLSKYAGKDIQLAFLFHSQINSNGYSYVAEGWYVDDVEIVSGPMEFRNPENFEASDFWDHWYTDNGVWEVGVPTGAPAERHDGSKVAGTIIDGNYCDAHYGRDSRLISPFTQVPAAPNPRLRFRYWFNFYWDDYVQVQVREVGGEWQPLPNGTYPPGLSSCGRWERASLDLSKYAGKDIQLAFLFHSQINSNGYSYVAEGWYVDDVEIVSGPMEFRNPENFEASDFWDHWYTDNGVWEVGVPTGAPAERHDGSKVAGTIIDGNYCDAHYGRDSRLISPFTQVPAAPNPRLRFRYWFNFYWDDYVQVQVREVGGEWQPLPNGTYPPGLSSCGRWERASLDLSKYAGKDIQLAFLFHSQINSNGYSYVAEGWYVDDVEIVSGPMEFRNPENFEASDFWDHWYTDNGVWEVGVPSHGPTNAFQGVRVAGTILDGNYCDAHYGRDSRLIGPWLRLPVAGSPTLTFQHWYDFNLDDFGAVEIRTPDGAWEELSRFTANSAGKWYSASASLAKYAGKDVQLGFLFHSRINSNGYAYVAPGWYLDQIEIRTGLLRVEPEAILFEGLLLDELTPGTFWARGALPGWRYGLAEGAPDGAAMDPDLGLFTWIPAECQGPALTFITLALFNERNQPMDLLEVPVFVLEVEQAPRIGTVPDLRIDSGVPCRSMSPVTPTIRTARRRCSPTRWTPPRPRTPP